MMLSTKVFIVALVHLMLFSIAIVDINPLVRTIATFATLLGIGLSWVVVAILYDKLNKQS